jgi:CubicO group peptidase (beta-lactamase class C family)
LLQGSRTATIKDVIDWVIGRPLDFAPDASYAYSNYGTMVLSYIVEKVSGMEYLEFLQKNLLNGLDIALYKDGAAAHASDRISQETRVIGYDALHPLSNQRISGVYGGGGDIKKQTMGAFSLAGSASSIAKFVGSHGKHLNLKPFPYFAQKVSS